MRPSRRVLVFAACATLGSAPMPAVAQSAARLVRTEPYPAVRLPADIWVDRGADGYWALIRRPDDSQVFMRGQMLEAQFRKLRRESLSVEPISGRPIFYAIGDAGDLIVGRDGPVALPEPMTTELAFRPLFAGTAMVPIYTSGKVGEFRLHVGTKVGPVSGDPPASATDASGALVAQTYSQGGKTYVVMPDGATKGPFESASSLKVSPDGTRTGFAFRRDGKLYIDLAGHEFGGWSQQLGAVIANSVTNFVAPVSEADGEFVVTATARYGPFPTGNNAIVVSDSGSRYAFLVPREGDLWAVQTETGVGPVAKLITEMRYSPSERHFAYYGRDPNSRYLVVYDGKPTVSRDPLDPLSFRFGADDRLLFVTRKGEQTNKPGDDRTTLYVDGAKSLTIRGLASLVATAPQGQPVFLEGGLARLTIGSRAVDLSKHCDSIYIAHVRLLETAARLFCRKGADLNLVEVPY